MDFYDVVIIGAGPAGLNCAKKLLESNKKILILEANEKIGPKICAGRITEKDFKKFNIPRKLIELEFNQFKFNSPLKKVNIKLKKDLVYTINREELGKWQLYQLENKKIKIRTKARVTKIEKDYVIINDSEKIFYKKLVGADGSLSLVRKYLNLSTKNLMIGIQYIVPNIISSGKYKDLEVFMDSKLFKTGYAWIFPHKDCVSIGCGVNPSNLSSKELNNNFHIWLKKNNIDISKSKYQGFPINACYQGCKFGNIFLAGDAAGLAFDVTGEGIYSALVSGEEVAKIIMDDNYSSQNINNLLKAKKKQKLVIMLLKIVGPFRNPVYNIFAILLENKLFLALMMKIM